MGWLRAIKQKDNPQATELSQLKEELRRVTQKLESREDDLAEALEQQTATSEILAARSRARLPIFNLCSTRWSKVPRGFVTLQMA